MDLRQEFATLPYPRPLEYCIGTTSSFKITDLPIAMSQSCGTYEDLSKMTDSEYEKLERYMTMWKNFGAPNMAHWVFTKRKTVFDGYSYDIGNRFTQTKVSSYSRILISKLVYVSGNGAASASSATQEDLWDVKLAVMRRLQPKYDGKDLREGPHMTTILINHPYSQLHLSTWDLVQWLNDNSNDILNEMLCVKVS